MRSEVGAARGNQGKKKVWTMVTTVIVVSLVAYALTSSSMDRAEQREAFELSLTHLQQGPPAPISPQGIGLVFDISTINVFSVSIKGGVPMYNQTLLTEHQCLERMHLSGTPTKSLQVYNTEKSFEQAILTEVDASASYSSTFFSMKASASYATNDISSTTSSFHTAHLDLRVYTSNVNILKCYTDPRFMTTDFLANLKRLELFGWGYVVGSSWYNYKLFIRNFGTHVIISYSEGNLLELWETTTQTGSTLDKEMKAKACASVEGDVPLGGSVSANVCAQYGKTTRQNAKKLRVQRRWRAGGGTTSAQAAVINHGGANPTLIQDFMNSWADPSAKPAMIGRQFKSIFDFLHEIYFPKCKTLGSPGCDNLQKAKNLEAYYVGIKSNGCKTIRSNGQLIKWLGLAPKSQQPSSLYRLYSCYMVQPCGKSPYSWCRSLPQPRQNMWCYCITWNQAGPIMAARRPSWLDQGLFKNMFPSCIKVNRRQNPRIVVNHGVVSSYNALMRAVGVGGMGMPSASGLGGLKLPRELSFFAARSAFDLAYFSVEKVSEEMVVESACSTDLDMLDSATVSAFGQLPVRIESRSDAGLYEAFLKQYGEYVVTKSRSGQQVIVFGWTASGKGANGLSVGESLLASMCARNNWLSSCSTCMNLSMKMGRNFSLMGSSTTTSAYSYQFGSSVRGGNAPSLGLSSRDGMVSSSSMYRLFGESSNGTMISVGYTGIWDVLGNVYDGLCSIKGLGSKACDMARRASNLAAVRFGIASVRQFFQPQLGGRSLGTKVPATGVTSAYVTNLYKVCNWLGYQLVAASSMAPGLTLSPSVRTFVEMMKVYFDFVKTHRSKPAARLQAGALKYNGNTLSVGVNARTLYLTPMLSGSRQLPNWNENYPTYPLSGPSSFVNDLMNYYSVFSTNIVLTGPRYKRFFPLVAISSEVIRDYAQAVSVLLALTNSGGGAWKARRNAFGNSGFLMMSAVKTVNTNGGQKDGSRALRKAKDRLRLCARDSLLEKDFNYDIWRKTFQSGQVAKYGKRVLAWINNNLP